ncbi:GNAT family N-acetyltransferase [Vogesella indigofera]|uniref:GNAT family N-acetyltransferase n=1 Tax=Vogesella indigofera TaxID=45465 RepID=UPI00234E5737|nr:GNAT family N-acetyltransferase [Vogesella indigofera]MDC7697681.1 GNAT family N-acetyltransferase [Vogesella indigofera]
MSDWHTAPVAADDFEALLALRIAAMQPSLSAIGRFDPQRARDRLAASFAPQHSRWIVLHGERIGWYALHTAADHLYLHHLYLAPTHSGHGIGSALLRQLQQQAAAQGLPIRLGALKHSAANLFYQRHGFVLLQADDWDNHYQWSAP